jgi:3-oxoadipate enol-lactonase
MSVAHLDGVDLYYEVHGTGPPVVLAHGGGGNHLSWWQQVPHLARTNTVITYDLRGFGSSLAAGRLSLMEQHIDDLTGLLDVLDIDQTALVGQSMGGIVAGGFAAQHPQRVRALVICSSWGGFETDAVVAWREELLATFSNGRAGHFHPRFPELQPELHFLFRQIAMVNPVRPDQLLDGLRALAGFRREVEPIVAAAIPTRFVVGEAEAEGLVDAVRSVAALIPGAEVDVIATAGHAAFFEQAAQVSEVIAGLLGSTSSTGSSR